MTRIELDVLRKYGAMLQECHSVMSHASEELYKLEGTEVYAHALALQLTANKIRKQVSDIEAGLLEELTK